MPPLPPSQLLLITQEVRGGQWSAEKPHVPITDTAQKGDRKRASASLLLSKLMQTDLIGGG